ncbi:MAG: translocation/assembly module TamB domain-containing protein [Vicinamibacterales bacterium]
MARWRQLGAGLARALGFAALGTVLVLAGGAALLRTDWALDRLRRLIVSQANQYLAATLEIGRLRGSLYRGVVLEQVRLSHNGQAIVAIDTVEVAYTIRELVGAGTSIAQVSLHRPVVDAVRGPDGRWNLTDLVRRDPNQPASNRPARPVRIDRIDVTDGSVTLSDPISVGAARVPTRFTHLDTVLAFASGPEGWRLDFSRAAFAGAAPDLDVQMLTGSVGAGDAGWDFRALHVVTPRSDVTVDGRVDRRQSPTVLDLAVTAPRFAFQEWSGVLSGLRNIAVDAAMDVTMRGPPSALTTTLAVRSTGGDVRGTVLLDSSVPGWHASGQVGVQRLDVARWLNRPDRPSDITGDVDLDIDLQLGGRFPRGRFAFSGTHAAYLDYEADDVVAAGTITETAVLLSRTTATAYGANVRLGSGTLAIDAPYAFRFAGTAAGVDLRRVPRAVPVPHVESSLAMEFDVTGQFVDPFITGSATFQDSVFLGATIRAGGHGSIDTRSTPIRYAGDARLEQVQLHRFGRDLAIDWLTEPRYDGTVHGTFRVTGTGTDLATMTLQGGGHLEEAHLFGGRLSDADVSVAIAQGSLSGSYDGELERIDPARAMNDPMYAARLSGHITGSVAVQDLLVRSPQLQDYTVNATIEPRASLVRGLEVAAGTVQASISGGTLQIRRFSTSGPGADIEASGTLELDGVRSAAIEYRVTRADLPALREVLGRDLGGRAVTAGRITGPTGRLRFAGEATVTDLAVSGVEARSSEVQYDVAIPSDAPARLSGSLDATLAGTRVSGRDMGVVDARLTYDAGQAHAVLRGSPRDGVTVAIDATGVLDLERQAASIEALDLTIQRARWTLRRAGNAAPAVSWTDTAVVVSGLELVDAATGQQRIEVAGTADDREGELRLTLRDVLLESLLLDEESRERYGGLLQAAAVIRGVTGTPTVAADVRIAGGRIRRLAYESLAGHVEFRDGTFHVDARLDQAPGVWLTAAGTVPLALVDRTRPPAPVRLAVKSSDVSLTLLEGVTDVVRNVTGQMRLDVSVLGTSSDPHFAGRVDLSDASFDVVASGARYRNGRMALQLSTDRVGVETLRVEDEEGDPLELTGSLGTHELRVGEMRVAVNARDFQVLRNEYGRVDIDASLNLSGEFESPRLTGRITVAGGALNVDRVLDRTLFQPYATQAAPAPTLSDIDPIVVLNPWERMGMDLELHVPGTLRMIGENVQVSPGTPLGLGNINVRAFGDLYLYKDPAQPMYVNGSFDSLSGTYEFQGRRFDLDPGSSINFRSDLNPELYITVNRVISGVETRVSMIGPLRAPELRLASTPPLDPSDILSLIVFNTSTNELSALQQQQLAVRAGTLAAGFIAAPMLSALERTLGIDTLEIEPGSDIRSGPRVTVGNEIAPGLVARFSRQFGPAEYDEATLEYYLSRIFRIRATFSDAGSLSIRSPFRRVERAGIDLLLFFSF